MGKMRRVFRSDSRPWTPPEAERYTTPEDAARVMLDVSGGSEADRARRRMLERQQRRSGSESAAEARQRMLQRATDDRPVQ